MFLSQSSQETDVHNSHLRLTVESLIFEEILSREMTCLEILKVSVDDHVVTVFNRSDVMGLTRLKVTLPATQGDVVWKML